MKTIFGAVLALGALSVTCMPASAATLDDVMARLESLQRDNQAMRKEIATLRQNNAPVTRQVAVPADVPSRSLPPGASNAMASATPARAIPYAPYNWSGFYAGLNAGYGSGGETTSLSAPPLVFTGSADNDGFFGGGQIGYNVQMGPVVLGIEADIQAANLGGQRHLVVSFAPAAGGLFMANKLESFGTARARIGFAFDQFLPYVTGGFAAGHNSFDVSDGNGTFTDAALHTGWVIGGGMEYGVRDGWSVKAEYLHVDLGSHEYLTGLFGVGSVFTTDLKFDLLRAGVNYRF